MGDEPLSDYEQRYTAIRQAGVEEEEKEALPANGGCGPRKPSKSQNLLDRLGGYWEEMLAFMKGVAVPFDPHLAERLAEEESQAEGIRMFSLPPLHPAE